LKPLLNNGTICLFGCFVGKNERYCQDVANATGARVQAYVGLSHPTGSWWQRNIVDEWRVWSPQPGAQPSPEIGGSSQGKTGKKK